MRFPKSEPEIAKLALLVAEGLVSMLWSERSGLRCSQVRLWQCLHIR